MAHHMLLLPDFARSKKRGGTVSDHRVFPSRREINRDLVKFGAALSVVAFFGCWLTNKGSLENCCFSYSHRKEIRFINDGKKMESNYFLHMF